ncbi:MAG: LysR family transcriptional regulator [Betaproteobacteria bacterium]|nr:MAG: LysR family transcriptional regulator [Betaproteobacteria bacterium]
MQSDWYIRRHLKLRHLQLLVAIDDLRNLGRVAASLNITQPAVSKMLGEVEKGLGVTLFERTARGVNPTVYGAALIDHARTVLGNLDVARAELRDLLSGASGKVAVGALPAVAPTLLPRSLALLKDRSPGTSVLVREGTQESLLQELLRGKLDLVVGTLPGRAPHFEEKVLYEDRFRLVARRQHPLAGRTRVTWSDLREYPWVLPPVGSLLREPLEVTFEEHGLAIPRNQIETLSVHVISGYVESTDAIGCLREAVAHRYQALGALAVLPLDLPKMLGPVGMTWSRERLLSSSARLMMKCLENAINHRASPRHARASG